VFGITTVQVATVPNAGKNGLPFVDRLGKRFVIEVPLPRYALSIPILDDKRLAHSTIGAPNARLGFVQLDAPDVPATITDCLVLFHRITVSALY
jgi:hypothetical protein